MAFIKMGDVYTAHQVDTSKETLLLCNKCGKEHTLVKPAQDILCNKCGTITKLSDFKKKEKAKDE